MNAGSTHYDVYDRESDYYRDIEDAVPTEKEENKEKLSL